ncbi:MAG: GNAT family N-acetyltransferase [Pseudomonadota bacterium]
MAQAEASYETTESASEADIETLDAGLHRHNLEAADLGAVRPLFVFARAAGGQIVGGLRARVWGSAWEVQQLWVDARHRRRGIGSELLRRVERAARERGGTLIYLDTFSFQAPALYERNGYEVACRFEGFPDGIVKYVMRRRLESTDTAR